MKPQDKSKIAFADAVINLMEFERDWSADTLAEVATFAREHDLGHNDHEGFFRAGPKPPPSWELLTKWTEGDHPVSWHYRYMGDGKAEHRITYGSQVIKSDSSISAAVEFGYCVRHSLECIGAFSEGPR